MTLLVMHPACLAHEMGDGHAERPDRLREIDRAFESEAFQMLARDIAPRANVAAIARLHPHECVEALRGATPTQGFTGLCHVAVWRTRSVGASGIVRPLRLRSATCSSPQREARGAFGLK